MNDPRAIANLILDHGERIRRPISNLALQKLLYFAHGLYLVERKRPLVSGFFEAWRFGPVHPTVYACFRVAGERPITFRAAAVNALTGQIKDLPAPTDAGVLDLVSRVMASYGCLTPGHLVDVSHAKGAPWDYVVERSRGAVALGLRIPDDVISQRFKFHKVSVSEVPKAGEPGDDTPILA